MYLSQNLHRLRSAWLISLLATMAVLILAACGGSSTPANPTTPATSQSTPTTATISQSTPATSATSSSTSTNSVEIKIVENNEQYSFSPATVNIVKGTKIVWTNMTDAPHTVTPDTTTTTAFTGSSTNLTHNQTYSLVINTAGTYAYHCDIHPYMKATITVTSSPSIKPLG